MFEIGKIYLTVGGNGVRIAGVYGNIIRGADDDYRHRMSIGGMTAGILLGSTNDRPDERSFVLDAKGKPIELVERSDTPINDLIETQRKARTKLKRKAAAANARVRELEAELAKYHELVPLVEAKNYQEVRFQNQLSNLLSDNKARVRANEALSSWLLKNT